MPVKSSRSSVLRWPDRESVLAAAREWAASQRESHPALLRIAIFGSYARGDSGVGSDLDLLVILDSSEQAFEARALGWDLRALPVPADLVVYTRSEWSRLLGEGARFALTVEREGIWLDLRSEIPRSAGA